VWYCMYILCSQNIDIIPYNTHIQHAHTTRTYNTHIQHAHATRTCNTHRQHAQTTRTYNTHIQHAHTTHTYHITRTTQHAHTTPRKTASEYTFNTTFLFAGLVWYCLYLLTPSQVLLHSAVCAIVYIHIF